MFGKFAAWLAALLIEAGNRIDPAQGRDFAMNWAAARGARMFGYKRIGASEYVRPLDSLTWFKVRDK